MIKLIASDLDGTLLQNGAQSLGPEVCSLIERLKEKGILFVAASGRQYGNLQRLFAPVKDSIAYICENGCLSFYQNRKIHKEVMSYELGQEILGAIWEKDTAEILLSGEHTSYIQPKKRAYYLHLRDVVKNSVTVVPDIFQVDEDYFKISIYEEKGITEGEAAYWHNLFDEKATVVTSGNEWLDTMPLGVNKGLAMEKMLNYLGIAWDECAAFGDNYNDIEMLQKVKYNFVMDNAPGDIRQISPYHASRVEDVLEALLQKGESSLEERK